MHYLTVTRTVTALVVAVIYKPTHYAQSPQLEFELVHAPSLEPRGLVALKKNKEEREIDVKGRECCEHTRERKERTKD